MRTVLALLVAVGLIGLLLLKLAALEAPHRADTRAADIVANLEAREFAAHENLVKAEYALVEATAETLPAAKSLAAMLRGAWIALEEALESARRIAK